MAGTEGGFAMGVRKYAYTYEIRGKYPGLPWETVDEADTLSEARRYLMEYRMAYGSEWRLTIRKAKSGLMA